MPDAKWRWTYPSLVASMIESLEYSFMTAGAKRSPTVAYWRPRNCSTSSFAVLALMSPNEGWEIVAVAIAWTEMIQEVQCRKLETSEREMGFVATKRTG